MWSINNLLSEAEAAKERIASAMGQQKSPEKDSTDDKNTSTVTDQTHIGPTIAAIPTKNDEVMSSLKSTWTTFAKATQNVTQSAIQNIEREQTKIQARLFQKGPYKRDLSLPLDTESLRDAEVVYITDRLITMGHPAMQSAVDGDITPDRKLAAVAHLLQKRHGGKFMVWNLSELDYDYSVLDEQVMTFEFPGSPSPPLGLLMKILLSLESWLKADEKNVAVMHCLTGRGRTSTVMSSFLCWMGEAGFVDPNRALEYMAQCKKLDLETLTIPSQRRYVGYFSNMLDGVRPSQPPLVLKRIIMSEAPKFEKYQAIQRGNSDNDGSDDEGPSDPLADYAGKLGCAPYLQIFKGGKLVFTTAASKSFNQGKDDLPFCFPFEKSITFPVETVVQGDILIRCRHLTRKGQRVSMFRAAMHTGYIPPKVLRLRKSDIDGACSDKRYADDFFIDLVFEECSASMASKHLLSSPEQGDEDENEMKFSKDAKGDVHSEASLRRMGGTIAGSETSGAVTVTASAYDSMLHRDSRFWDVIAQRRNEKSTTTPSDHNSEAQVSSVFYGSTIGRRREFKDETSSSNKSKDGGDSGKFSVSSQQSALQSFTIGGELDFTLTDEKSPSSSVSEAAEDSHVEKKDDLMDALMAIDDELDDDDADEDAEDSDQNNDNVEVPSAVMTEEILFDAKPVSLADLENKDEADVLPKEADETSKKNDNDPCQPSAVEVVAAKIEEIDDSVNIDDLNIEDMETANIDTADGDDDFNFSDDDDDELADLEQFLMKAAE